MKYKTFARSERIKNVKREVERTYKKVIRDCQKVEEEELLFKTEE